MTRHRRGDIDGDDEEAPPWRARDYERAPRQPDAAGEYFPAPWDDPARGAQRPARGALGTSSNRDAGPGEATGPPWERTAPPWELPGWDDSQPIRRVPRPGGLTGAHPSGPLPAVPSSGPLPAVPADPLAPLPPDSGSWPDPRGGDYPGPALGSERSPGSGYPPDPYLDGEGAGYPATGREPAYPGRHGDAPYLRTGYAESGYGGGREPDQDYTGTDSGYPGYGDPSPGQGGYERDSYAGEPGYGDDGFGREDYGREPGHEREPGYPPGAGYPADEGYRPGEGYPAGDGYGRDGAYPRQAGYPGDPEAGYPDDDEYPASRAGQLERGAPSGHPRDHDDDRGYGERGDWYGDVDDDQAWADDEYDDGFLPGLTTGADSRRAQPGAPGRDHAHRAGSTGTSRSRGGSGGKGKGRKSGIRRAAPWIALTVLVVALTVLGGVGYYLYRTYLHPPDYSGPGTGTVTVQIKSGETATQVGQQLQQQGVVASVRAFSNAAKASGHGSSLQPGYYRLHKHMAAALAFALLLNPSSRIQLNILVPEGLRLSEIIALLGKDTGNLRGYQQAIKNIPALGLPSYAKGNLEGYLFPATYTVQPGTAPAVVLRQMVQRFGQEAASVNLRSMAVHDQVSEGDLITVASIVQAEGQRPGDMAKIARVIYNRLNSGMRLQLDSTVLYALHSRASDVTIADTQNTKSPYNTYLHNGLPPGPIDSPGDAAIRAALHPAAGNWLFFLTVNPRTGLTKFTNSYAQFQVYVSQLDTYLAKHS